MRPNFLGNIGSTARVMKNFGFSQLRLVNPPRNYLDAEARKMAVDAFDVLKSAKVENSLSDALKDINLAFGLDTNGKAKLIRRPDGKLTANDEAAQKIILEFEK